MNVKTTLILLVLAVVGLGLLIAVQVGWIGDMKAWLAGKPDQPDAADDRLLLSGIGEVSRLTLGTPMGETISLARDGKGWRLTVPLDAPATGWQVDSTISILTTLEYSRKYAPDDKDAPSDDLTRLNDPLRTVTLVNDQGQSRTVLVGKNPPMDSARTYVRLAGDDHVYVVERNLLSSLDKSANDYRDKAVAKFDTDRALRVTVRGDRSFQLAKTGERWRLTEPVAARAETQKVDSLLRAVADLAAAKFVDDKPRSLSAYGLDQPSLTVTVEVDAATTVATQPAAARATRVVSVAFGAVAEKDKTVFAKLADKPWVFEVSASRAEQLQPKLLDLRDKRVLDMPDGPIARVEVALSAGTSATLEKVDGAWRMRSPFAGDCDGQSVEKLITTMRDLKVAEFQDNPPSLQPFGLAKGKEVGKVTLSMSDSDASVTLLLGRSSRRGHMAFVQRPGSQSVAVISVDDYAVLLRPAPAYWHAGIFELPADAEVTAMELQRPSGAFKLSKQPDGKFNLLAPISAPADADNVRALLEALRAVRAQKIISLDTQLPERFAKLKPIRIALSYRQPIPAPPATAPATASAPDKPEPEYAVGKSPTLLAVKDRGMSYVWQQGAMPLAVGELPASFYDKLDAELRDRAVLDIDADHAESLKVNVGDTPMGFNRAGDVWRYDDDPFVKTDADKIKQFLRTLSQIRASRFADYGDKPDLKRFGLDKPAMTIEITLESGKTVRLAISGVGPVGSRGLYATSSDVPGVWVLAPETGGDVTKSLQGIRKEYRPGTGGTKPPPGRS